MSSQLEGGSGTADLDPGRHLDPPELPGAGGRAQPRHLDHQVARHCALEPGARAAAEQYGRDAGRRLQRRRRGADGRACAGRRRAPSGSPRRWPRSPRTLKRADARRRGGRAGGADEVAADRAASPSRSRRHCSRVPPRAARRSSRAGAAATASCAAPTTRSRRSSSAHEDAEASTASASTWRAARRTRSRRSPTCAGSASASCPKPHQVELIDVLVEPMRALADGVLMTPTLIKLAPLPVRKIVGSLSEARPASCWRSTCPRPRA